MRQESVQRLAILTDETEIDPMAITEHMVDFDIVVIEVGRRSPSPRISRCVEAVPETKIIGKRHKGHQFLNGPGRIKTPAIKILAKDADGLQVIGRRRRLYRLPRQVYSRN